MKHIKLPHTVGSYESDIFNNMKADFVMKEMQEAATIQMTREGLPYDTLLERGVALLINRMDIEFLAPIKKYDELVFESWPCQGKGATLPRKYLVYRGGELVASAVGQWSAVDVNTMKILRAGSVDFSMFTVEEDSNATCTRFKIPEEDNLKEIASFKVSYNDVDNNGHLNNTNYLRMVQNYIPELLEGSRIRRARLHFAKEAALGSKIRLFSTSCEEEGQKVYYFRSSLEGGEINAQIQIVLE